MGCKTGGNVGWVGVEEGLAVVDAVEVATASGIFKRGVVDTEISEEVSTPDAGRIMDDDALEDAVLWSEEAVPEDVAVEDTEMVDSVLDSVAGEELAT